MSDLDQKMPQLEVDAWERRRQRIKRHYIEQRGMSEDEADNKATWDVRQSIRQGR